MKTHHDANTAERTGAAVARGCRRLRQQERKLIAWFTSKGWNTRAVTLFVRAVELVTLGVLLYAAFWLALLLLFALAVAWTVLNTGWQDDKQPEIRDGHSGIGLYDKDDWRIDMGDPEKP